MWIKKGNSGINVVLQFSEMLESSTINKKTDFSYVHFHYLFFIIFIRCKFRIAQGPTQDK